MTTKKKRKFVEPQTCDATGTYFVNTGLLTGEVYVRPPVLSGWAETEVVVLRKKEYQRLLKLARKGYGK